MRVGENATIRPDTKFSVRFYDSATISSTPVTDAAAVMAEYMQVRSSCMCVQYMHACICR